MSQIVNEAKAEQAVTFSQGAFPNRRINMQMVQNVLVIWLNSSSDEKSIDCHNTLTQLQGIGNIINSFTDADPCIDFLTDIDNVNVCMIISDALCQHIVPLLHEVPHLQKILIFSTNKTQLEQWAKKWPKVESIFSEISSICEALKRTVQQCERNTISMSFTTISDDSSKENLDRLPPQFMYTQILKEVLLSINFEQKHFMEFIDYCRNIFAGNEIQLNIVEKLQREYCDTKSIWWYTYECFLHSMLNRALRAMDADIIVKIGFFICDLHRHIEKLHKQQSVSQESNNRQTLYRGQGMLRTDFEQMTKNKGGLISFNNFLSTSKNLEHSLFLAETNQANLTLVGILFVMTIDASKSSAPFASINDMSQFAGEDEVLFSMHTVFRICDITSVNEADHLFRVELTLTSDNDKDLHQLTNRIREETFPDSEGWNRLGLVLLQMGYFEKAQRIFKILLEQETEESAKTAIYEQLGNAKIEQGEYEEATRLYEKLLIYQQQSLPPNHPDLVASYNNIGSVYDAMGDYPKSLSFYEKALAIRQQSLPSNHPDLAASYNNIGNVYSKMGDYSKSLSFYEKALAIRQRSFPPNHPHLASSYNNIGLVYSKMGDYPKSLPLYEKALAIQQQSLPPNHPDLAASYHNIGLVYSKMGDYPKALSFYEKALAIQQQSLPPNHPHLAMSYNNIGGVYDVMGDYPKSLSFYEKSLVIRQQSLPPNHPHLAGSYYNIGLVYSKVGDYPRSLSCYEKALAIQQQSLPPNHPHLAMLYEIIVSLHQMMSNY